MNSWQQLLDGLTISPMPAKDNAKLLVALLNASEQHGEVFISNASEQDNQAILVHWQERDTWCHCGGSAFYQAIIEAIPTEQVTQYQPLKALDVAVIAPDQIPFLLAQYAHFDHCY